MKLDIKKPYTKSRKIQVGSFEPTITQQHHEKQSNINSIMARALKTGQMPPPKNMNPMQYGDFANGTDYQSALNQVIQAEQAFDALPSHIRNRFRNDPAELLTFLSDSNNREEAIKLGLVKQDMALAGNGGKTLEEVAPVPALSEPSKGSQQVSGSATGTPGEPANTSSK